MSNKAELNINPSFPSMLTLVFVVMKCMGYIDWSWWLVFSPIIAFFVLAIIVVSVIAVCVR